MIQLLTQILSTQVLCRTLGALVLAGLVLPAAAQTPPPKKDEFQTARRTRS